MNNNICSICKQKNVPIDITKIKFMKLKIFINNNRINKEDYSTLIKKCNCNKKVHKLCILLNIIFNYELKCLDCNSFYNISVTKETDVSEKLKIIILTIFLVFIHIILYGCCAALIIFNINKLKMNDFSKLKEEKFIFSQFFFALIIFVINNILVFITTKSILLRLKYCYKYFINIHDKNSNNIDDSQYFQLLYGFYRSFHKDKLRYLIYKRNQIFFSNRIIYNKDILNIIKKNSDFQPLSNGNIIENDKNKIIKNNEQNLNLNTKNINNNNTTNAYNDNSLSIKSKTEYLYKKWNPKSNGVDGIKNIVKKTSTIKEENKNKEHEDIRNYFDINKNKNQIIGKLKNNI